MAEIVISGNQRTNPRWLADFNARERTAIFPAKLDKTLFANYYGVTIALTASAAAGATTIAVAALLPPQPSVVPISAAGSLIIRANSIIDFGGAKFARVTSDVFLGATSIPVSALPTALAGTEVAQWSRYGTIFIPSGLLVGRMFTSRDSGTGLFTPSVGTEDEMYLTLNDVIDLEKDNNVELLRPNAGVNVKINYLPGYATLAGAVVTAINARYNTIKGVN
jgi:hypothetical protein